MFLPHYRHQALDAVFYEDEFEEFGEHGD